MCHEDVIPSPDQWAEDINPSAHKRFKGRRPSLTILFYPPCGRGIKISGGGYSNREVAQINSEKRMFKAAPPFRCSLFIVFSERNDEECAELKEIITKYCKTSGQHINSAKLNPVSIRGTNEDICKAIEEEQQIHGVTDPGRYLGLPSIRG